MKDKDRIKQLEGQLDLAQNPYVNEIYSLHCSNGELYIGYDDKDKIIVINIDTFYKDLPSIISMVTKENTKQQKMYAEGIKESIKQL
tara:strand:- start:355 stop:615 length:261 start_codon:yes stop_codon:yes gene_type:complete